MIYCASPPYRPLGLWECYDFQINRCYWEIEGVNNAYDIRMRNLCDLSLVLSDLQVTHWLFGKTLYGAVNRGKLLDDHDDDIGVYTSSREIIMASGKKRLEDMGFNLIRDTAAILSFERCARYVDICIFKVTGTSSIGYNHKSIHKKHFKSLARVELDGHAFPVPACSSELLRKLYPTSLFRRVAAKLPVAVSSNTWLEKLRKLPTRLRLKYVSLLEKNHAPTMRNVLESLAPFCGLSVKMLSCSDFTGLHIEPHDSFNWKWRYRHLSLVTNGNKLTQISDIVNYISMPGNVKSIDAMVDESDTSRPFHVKSNFDMRFWWSGNNYFWYCVKYQFRKDVVPYSMANKYIEEVGKPLLYSAKYYESLKLMNEAEIRNFLKRHPIVIENGCVTSGKHRVFAMIGRLGGGKSYIPIKAVCL